MILEDNELKLQNLLNSLKKNKANVPEDLLRTKYAASYGRLKEEIKSVANTILQENVFMGMAVRQDNGANVITEIQSVVDSEHTPGGLFPQMSTALFKECNVYHFLSCVEQMREKVWKAYLPYFNETNGLAN